MGAKLFGFVFKTLRKRVNDPANPTYWLPKVLREADGPNGSGKLLPLTGTDWDLGQLTGEGGTTFREAIKGQWWNSLVRKPGVEQHQAIPCPNQPWPLLAMPTVTIHGLENVFLLDQPETSLPGSGYNTVMTLQFGYYDGQNNLPNLDQLRVEGQYSLHQCLCSTAAEGSTGPCDNWAGPLDIHGTGTYKATLTGVYVDAALEVRIIGSGANRSLKVTVTTLTMRGEGGSLPGVTVDDLTVDTSWTFMSKFFWIPKAKQAITSTEGRTGLVTNLNATLNQPANREKLGDLMTSQFNKVLDDNLGKVAPGTLPTTGQTDDNPVDQYLFDRVRVALNDQGSPFYLPKAIYGNTDPRLEPFRMDEVFIGDQTYQGIQFHNLKLTQVTMTGLSNMAAPIDKLVTQGSVLNGVLSVSTLNPPPKVTVMRNGVPAAVQVPAPPLLITGKFSMTAEDDPTVLGGSITIKVRASQVTSSMSASGDELDDLQLQFQSLVLSAAPADIEIKVSVDSVFQDTINEMINQDSVKIEALKGINQQAQANLGAISREATNGARKAINAKLSG